MEETLPIGAVLYHGTPVENVDRILKLGFSKGTYFARHLEDAIRMGGDHVFEIWMKEDPSRCWEWICPEPIPPDRILTLIDYNPRLVHWNREEQVTVRKDILTQENPDWTLCEECKGRGQLEEYPPLTRSRKRDKVTLCSRCNGHGSQEKYKFMKTYTHVKGRLYGN